MSVKSDRWIRRMAEQHGMIEPFERNQIKQVNGRPVVSFGTSSYGYDVRCSDDFKLFTDINSTIVDPKNFDPKSFVDVKGEFCIIPPNSFALARTVEYFRIPRNVLTLCLGKCVTGDTRVVDAADRSLLADRRVCWRREDARDAGLAAAARCHLGIHPTGAQTGVRTGYACRTADQGHSQSPFPSVAWMDAPRRAHAR